ncbi:MAG: AI-2E family transporter [Pseudomonadota bacterium]
MQDPSPPVPIQSSAPSPTQGTPPVRQRRAQVALWLVGGLFALALVAALRAVAPVAIPVTFAVLIALMTAPLHARLERALPAALGWLAHLAVMLILLAIVTVFLGALIFAAQRILEAMPDVTGNLQSLVPSQEQADAMLGGQLRELWGTLSSTLGGWLVDQITGIAQAVAGMTGVFLTTLVLVFFLVLLALTERTVWQGKMQAMWPADGAHAWAGALTTLTRRLRQFLVIRTVIGVLQAALYVGWLALFGVDLLVVWAVLTFVLTYIPNIGSVISGVLPVLYVLLTRDWTTALGVAAGLLVVEQVVGNYLDPKFLGQRIALSPFVILVALLFWSWLWGVAGAFLSTPLMLSLLVVFNQIGALRPVALVFSDQPNARSLDRALSQE